MCSIPSRASARPTWVSRFLSTASPAAGVKIGVEARGQTRGGEHLKKRPERRNGAFLLDQKRRIDLAGGIIQRHDEIKLGRPFEPRKGATILMQHHAHAWLARPLAPVRPAPGGPLHKPRRLQLHLGPGVAPAEVVLPLQVLVEVLHVPTHVVGPVLAKHPDNLVDRHPLARRLAKTPIRKPGQPILRETLPVTPELPLRHPENLASFNCRKLLALPAVQHILELLHPAVL